MQVKSIAESAKHSAILKTFIKLPIAIKTFVLSIFDWPLKTCLAVYLEPDWLEQNHITALCK